MYMPLNLPVGDSKARAILQAAKVIAAVDVLPISAGAGNEDEKSIPAAGAADKFKAPVTGGWSSKHHRKHAVQEGQSWR